MQDEPLILLVEDREDDIIVIRRAFERAGITTTLQVVRDGEEAISYLAGSGKYASRTEYPLPWLILLDLKMPRVDGFEVLKWIRKEPGLHSLLVVALTASAETRDIDEAYALGANCFMVKPVDFENTMALANLLVHYWLQHNRFPETHRRSPNEAKVRES